MGCNTAQNEIGGKELLLKACQLKTYTTDGTTADITSTAHGLKVGDLFSPLDVATITNLDVGVFYFVTAVTANTFQVALTQGGTAIIPDDNVTALECDVYKSLGGIRSKSLAFQAEGIDITNQESDEWKTMLNGAGIRSGTISGGGVYNNNEMFQLIEDKFFANELTCLMFIDVKTYRIYAGCFKITSLEASGDYDAEGQFSISAESSGPIARQKSA
jgi:TP901-1 family phage major tail protein